MERQMPLEKEKTWPAIDGMIHVSSILEFLLAYWMTKWLF
jgi:hypothetical protein